MRKAAMLAVWAVLTGEAAAGGRAPFESRLGDIRSAVIEEREALSRRRAASGEYYGASELAKTSALAVSSLRRDLKSILGRLAPNDSGIRQELERLIGRARDQEGLVAAVEAELDRMERNLGLPDSALVMPSSVLHWEAIQLRSESRKLNKESSAALSALSEAGYLGQARDLRSRSLALYRAASNVEFSAARLKSFHERSQQGL